MTLLLCLCHQYLGQCPVHSRCLTCGINEAMTPNAVCYPGIGHWSHCQARGPLLYRFSNLPLPQLSPLQNGEAKFQPNRGLVKNEWDDACEMLTECQVPHKCLINVSYENCHHYPPTYTRLLPFLPFTNLPWIRGMEVEIPVFQSMYRLAKAFLLGLED